MTKNTGGGHRIGATRGRPAERIILRGRVVTRAEAVPEPRPCQHEACTEVFETDDEASSNVAVAVAWALAERSADGPHGSNERRRFRPLARAFLRDLLRDPRRALALHDFLHSRLLGLGLLAEARTVTAVPDPLRGRIGELIDSYETRAAITGHSVAWDLRAALASTPAPSPTLDVERLMVAAHTIRNHTGDEGRRRYPHGHAMGPTLRAEFAAILAEYDRLGSPIPDPKEGVS